MRIAPQNRFESTRVAGEICSQERMQILAKGVFLFPTVSAVCAPIPIGDGAVGVGENDGVAREIEELRLIHQMVCERHGGRRSGKSYCHACHYGFGWIGAAVGL